jgi:hypothetical protein
VHVERKPPFNRTRVQHYFIRAVFGSGSQYVLQHCEDIPVTVVSTEEQSD